MRPCAALAAVPVRAHPALFIVLRRAKYVLTECPGLPASLVFVPARYGFSAKGASCVLYHDRALRKMQYYAISSWPGGLFVSPSMLGTRAGGCVHKRPFLFVLLPFSVGTFHFCQPPSPRHRPSSSPYTATFLCCRPRQVGIFPALPVRAAANPAALLSVSFPALSAFSVHPVDTGPLFLSALLRRLLQTLCDNDDDNDRPIASAWATMRHYGQNGYKDTVSRLMETTDYLYGEISKIKGK